MQVGKMKPAATIVAQFPAGVEVESIQHEGKLFMPVLSLGEFAPKIEEPAPVSEPETKKTEPSAKKAASKKYTEDELMEMPVKELSKILTKMGIDPDDFDGKNTNKKLRNLILDNQDAEDVDTEEETNEEEEEEEEETPKTKKAPKKKEEDDDDEDDDEEDEDEDSPVAQVTSILEDFDAGKKNKKKTIAAIVDVLGDVDSDKVASLVEEFTDDSDADMEEFAQRIVDTFTKKKGAKKPAKKSKKEEEELVDVEDLKKGDRVSVYWDDDNQDWFDGTVASVKKGKVVIDYDDDTSEPIDPEVHTKIKRLAE